MVLYPLLPVEALHDISQPKSISSFEICNSDSRLKQAIAFSFHKAAATVTWTTLGIVIFRFLAEYSNSSNNVNGKQNIEIIIVVIIIVKSQ